MEQPEEASHGLTASVDYDNSILFDVYRVSDNKKLKPIVDALVLEILPLIAAKYTRRLHGKKRSDYRDHIRLVVLNLYAAWRLPLSPCVAYTRHKGKYCNGERMERLFIKKDYLTRTIDAMVEAGYVGHQPGFKDRRKGGAGRNSRMWATLKLASVFAGYRMPTPTKLAREEIEIRATSGQLSALVPVPDIPQVRTMRTNVRRINSLLAGLEITLGISSREYLKLVERMHCAPNTYNDTVRRIFNHGSLTKGGRFYGHWVQGLPREYREFLRIGGEPVVELDYSGLHPRMLYAIKGAAPPDGDLYAVPGHDAERDLLKNVLLVAINAEDEKSTVQAVMKEFNLDRRRRITVKAATIRKLLAAIKAAHPALADLFCTGQGIDLQNRDSRIAESVMLQLADQGIPSVPLHDSFIVGASHAQALHTAMTAAAEAEMGSTVPFPIKPEDWCQDCLIGSS